MKVIIAAALLSLAIPAFAADNGTVSTDQSNMSQDIAFHGGGGQVNRGGGPVYRGGGPVERGGGPVYRGGGPVYRGGERGYPGYDHDRYYGTWADRRWERGGYYYGGIFYPVIGFQYYQCTAVDGYGRFYNYDGDIYDAQAGALGTCEMYGGYTCMVTNCVIL